MIYICTVEYENLRNFNPSECISGKMMRLNRVIANVFRKHLKSFNITNSQVSLLFILIKAGGLTQKQLSGFAQLEKSSLNRNLKRLFDKNYITKTNFPIIEITSKGKSFVNKIIPEWQKAMDEISELLEEDGKTALGLVYTKLLN